MAARALRLTAAETRAAHHRYWVGGERAQDVAAAFGCSRVTLMRTFRVNGLPRRPAGLPHPLDGPCVTPGELRMKARTLRLVAEYDAIDRARMDEDAAWCVRMGIRV